MIENLKAEGLTGQLELEDLMGDGGTGNREQGTAGETAEGYDAAGNLINPDAGATGARTSPAPDGAPSPSGEGMEASLEAFPIGEGGAIAPEEVAASDRLRVIATEIITIEEQARGVVLSAAVAIGKRLVEAKNLVPAGRWLEWLEGNISYSERRAQDLMRLAEQYGRGTIPDAVSKLDYSKAVALLSAPEDQREALAERARDEGLSVRQLQDEIKKLKVEKTRAQMRIDDMEGQIDGLRDEIARMDEQDQRQDAAIVERDEQLRTARDAIEREREAARLAEAKAKAAEASADELRKLHSDAEDRAAASAQRASDAVNRANQTAKELTEARAKIAELEAREQETGNREQEAPRVVEVVPEDVRRELEELRTKNAELAAALDNSKPSPVGEGGPRSGSEEVPVGPTAVDRFKWFYTNQMKPTFETALRLLTEVAREDGHAASMFATALNKACQQLMNQLGE